MKATEIIRAALTRLGVYATGDEVSAEDTVTALDTLNGLLSEYELQSLIDMPVDLYLPIEIDTDIPMIDSLQRLIILGLAVDLAPDYGIEPSASLLRQQARAMTVVKHSNTKPIYSCSQLPLGCNRYGFY